MEKVELTPEILAEKRRKLAQEYNEKMKELSEIKKKKVYEIIKLLPEHKTINKAELYWSSTDEGQQEIQLEYYIKGLLELIRSLKTEIDMKAAEAWGKY